MKVKYHLLKNTGYALSGFKSLLLEERSFLIEFFIIIPLVVWVFYLPFNYFLKVLLVSVLILVLLTEALNSAIENVVDLISPDYHPLAKKAKDCGSAAVFFSILNAILWWGLSLGYHYYFLN